MTARSLRPVAAKTNIAFQALCLPVGMKCLCQYAVIWFLSNKEFVHYDHIKHLHDSEIM